MVSLKRLATKTLQFNEPELPRFMDLIYGRISADILTQREDQIRERLAIIGYSFNSLFEWRQFCNERLIIVSYYNKPEWRELYIDYGKPEQIMVSTWWDTFQFMTTDNDADLCHSFTIVSGNAPSMNI